jgi:hypothetical protein
LETPLVPQDVAVNVLVLNIVLPGAGTIVAAFYDVKGFNSGLLGVGIAQILLTLVLAGLIWSVIMGIQIFNKSNGFYD